VHHHHHHQNHHHHHHHQQQQQQQQQQQHRHYLDSLTYLSALRSSLRSSTTPWLFKL
jgi:hypothetical protein